MSRLLFYHDFASPYCRLALDAVTEAAERTGLEVRPVPFELWPAPTELPTIDDPTVAEELDRARELASDQGIRLQPPTALPRTRKAHEAVAFGIDHGAGAAVLRGIYEQLWSEGQDISRIDVLTSVAEAAGLDPEELHVALGTDRYEADVVREQHAVTGAGIEAVPAVQVGAVMAAGLLPPDELADWIRENR